MVMRADGSASATVSAVKYPAAPPPIIAMLFEDAAEGLMYAAL